VTTKQQHLNGSKEHLAANLWQKDGRIVTPWSILLRYDMNRDTVVWKQVVMHKYTHTKGTTASFPDNVVHHEMDRRMGCVIMSKRKYKTSVVPL
jgi:hypothetical protein